MPIVCEEKFTLGQDALADHDAVDVAECFSYQP
jgi:hypothetical protein